MAESVRLIDADNNQVGVVGLEQAKSVARSAGLDLVEISPNSKPPVCRVMDYGKYLYEMKRKDKLNTKKQHAVVVKEIRFRPKIDTHDRDTKLGHARKFIEKGNRVQITMMFRGREMMHIDNGRKIMEEVVESLEDIAKVDREPRLQGKRITMVVVPK